MVNSERSCQMLVLRPRSAVEEKKSACGQSSAARHVVRSRCCRRSGTTQLNDLPPLVIVPGVHGIDLTARSPAR